MIEFLAFFLLGTRLLHHIYRLRNCGRFFVHGIWLARKTALATTESTYLESRSKSEATYLGLNPATGWNAYNNEARQDT